jgi:hypothetical protein
MLGVEPVLVSEPEDGAAQLQARVNDTQRPLGLAVGSFAGGALALVRVLQL